MKIRKIPFFVVSILLFFSSFSYGRQADLQKPKLVFFHSLTCHKCIQVKNEVIPEIEKEFLGRIQIDYRDIADIENYKLMLSLKEKYNPQQQIEVPLFFFEGKFLASKVDLKNNLRNFIERALKEARTEEINPQVDLVGRFKTFEPLAIIGAGLVDGINPCAFTVIVFFISFLSLQGYRRIELVCVGLAFIFAVFLTYLLLGLGIFNFLYSLKGFWIIIKTVNIFIGIFSITLGIFALYDFYKFRKTGKTEGLLLQLPAAVKNRIHYVIGLHYRRPKDSGGINSRPHIVKLLISALITGFLVSLLEAVCTGQLYLPTITFVLKTTPLKLQALGYLLLYNFMFVLPLFIIFLLALLGATSGQFSEFFKKRLLAIKIIMAVVFFGLGIFLIWRA